MGHEIGLRDTQVGVEVAWHELTRKVDVITRDNCGICYDLEKARLYLQNGIPTKHFIIVSKDDGLPIGEPVTDRYTVIPNGRIWDAVMEAMNGTPHVITSVGTCSDRSRGFISIKLDSEFKAAGRITKPYLNILWGHGGNLNVIAKCGFIQVVCRNTYNASMSERSDFNFQIRHTGDAAFKLEGMSKALDAYAGTVAQFRQSLDKFAQVPVSREEARAFFAGFVVDDFNPEKFDPKSDKISSRAKNQYNEMSDLFRWGAGNAGETAADIFGAATDYYTHGSKNSDVTMQQRFESSEFGNGQQRKFEVFELLSGRRIARVGDYGACVARGESVLKVA